MEEEIVKILKDNFKGENIDIARKQLCFYLGITRSDEPKCPDCKSEDLYCLGNYVDTDKMTGAEYKCNSCEKEFDFDDFN